MYGKILLPLLFLFLINNIYICAGMNTTVYIMTYEYGSNVPGEELSYVYRGDIPPFISKYTHVINPVDLRHDLQKEFTYLKVEYISPMSKVEISYDPQSLTLYFIITIPFLHINFGVAGFALKKTSLRHKHGHKHGHRKGNVYTNGLRNGYRNKNRCKKIKRCRC